MHFIQKLLGNKSESVSCDEEFLVCGNNPYLNLGIVGRNLSKLASETCCAGGIIQVRIYI